MPPYDIWKVQDSIRCVDGPYQEKPFADEVARELTDQTGERHIAVEQGSEQEKQLLRMNPYTK